MATKTTAVKTAFKKITAAKPADPAAETKPAGKGKAGETPASKPEPPKEALSLIDEKPKRSRERKPASSPGSKPFVALPSISRILSPEPPPQPEPEPEPEPAAVPEATAAAPAAAEETPKLGD